MATCELKGELTRRNGQTNTFVVKSEANLKALIAGVKKFNSETSEVLTGLVEEEKSLAGDGGGNCHVDYEDEDDSDEQEDEPERAAVKPNSEPPAKRLKPLKP